MKPIAEVSVAYARVVLQSGAVSPDKLLEGVDLTLEQLSRTDFIASEDLQIIYDNYDQLTNDRLWTARLGVQLNIGAHGPLGFAALSAPTLGAAMDVIAELVGSRNTTMRGETSTVDGHYLLTLEETVMNARYAAWIMEVLFKIVEELLASVLGHPVSDNVAICFAHPAPEQADSLSGLYNSRVLFDQETNSVAIPLAWRYLPSPLHDESLFRTNIIKCREIIETRNRTASVSGKVHNLLSKHFDRELLRETTAAAPPTLASIAHTLCYHN